MDWLTIVLTGVSLLIGGLITIGVSRHYYVKASEALQREAEELKEQNANLRRLNGLTIRILEEAGLLPDNVEATKDEAGNPTGGLTYKLRGTANIKLNATMDPKVTRRKDQPESTGQEATD